MNRIYNCITFFAMHHQNKQEFGHKDAIHVQVQGADLAKRMLLSPLVYGTSVHTWC